MSNYVYMYINDIVTDILVYNILTDNNTFCKYRSTVVGGPNSIESSMKAARAALMLVPILGVHFILLPMRPDPGSALEDIYLIASAIASSYQVHKTVYLVVLLYVCPKLYFPLIRLR